MQVPCLQFTLITSRTEVRSQLIADDEKAMVLNRLRLTLSLYWFHKKQVVWLLVLFSAFLSGARRLHAIWRTNYQIGADLTNRILALVPGGTHAAAPLCNLKWILSKKQQLPSRFPISQCFFFVYFPWREKAGAPLLLFVEGTFVGHFCPAFSEMKMAP